MALATRTCQIILIWRVALGGKAISCLNDYIDRIASLNEAIEGLNDYLKARETPYVFGYFW